MSRSLETDAAAKALLQFLSNPLQNSDAYQAHLLALRAVISVAEESETSLAPQVKVAHSNATHPKLQQWTMGSLWYYCRADTTSIISGAVWRQWKIPSKKQVTPSQAQSQVGSSSIPVPPSTFARTRLIRPTLQHLNDFMVYNAIEWGTTHETVFVGQILCMFKDSYVKNSYGYFVSFYIAHVFSHHGQ